MESDCGWSTFAQLLSQVRTDKLSDWRKGQAAGTHTLAALYQLTCYMQQDMSRFQSLEGELRELYRGANADAFAVRAAYERAGVRVVQLQPCFVKREKSTSLVADWTRVELHNHQVMQEHYAQAAVDGNPFSVCFYPTSQQNGAFHCILLFWPDFHWLRFEMPNVVVTAPQTRTPFFHGEMEVRFADRVQVEGKDYPIVVMVTGERRICIGKQTHALGTHTILASTAAPAAPMRAQGLHWAGVGDTAGMVVASRTGLWVTDRDSEPPVLNLLAQWQKSQQISTELLQDGHNPVRNVERWLSQKASDHQLSTEELHALTAACNSCLAHSVDFRQGPAGTAAAINSLLVHATGMNKLVSAQSAQARRRREFLDDIAYLKSYGTPSEMLRLPWIMLKFHVGELPWYKRTLLYTMCMGVAAFTAWHVVKRGVLRRVCLLLVAVLLRHLKRLAAPIRSAGRAVPSGTGHVGASWADCEVDMPLVELVAAKATKKTPYSRVCVSCLRPAEERFRWKNSVCGDCRCRFKQDSICYDNEAAAEAQLRLWSGLSPIRPVVGAALRAPALGACPKPKPPRYLNGVMIEPLVAAQPDDNQRNLQDCVRRGAEAWDSRSKFQSYSRHRHAWLVGIGFVGCPPSTFAKTGANLAIAVNNRLAARNRGGMGGTGEPCPKFWKLWGVKLLARRRDVVRLFFPTLFDQEPVQPLPFAVWAAAFPKARRQEFARALVQMKLHGFDGRHCHYQNFVKQELAYAVNSEGVVPKNPRSIANSGPQAHVVTGVWCRPLTHAFKAACGPKSPLFYASADPDTQNLFLDQVFRPVRVAIGEVAQASVHNASMTNCKQISAGLTATVSETVAPVADALDLQEWHVLESDFTSMDSSYSKGAFSFLAELYSVLGMPIGKHDRRSLLKQVWHKLGNVTVSGSIGFGQFYRRHIGPVNASGRDDTAINNFVVNAWMFMVGVIQFAGYTHPKDVDVAVVAAIVAKFHSAFVGDDMITFCHKSLDHVSLSTHLESASNQGGFEMKMLVKSDPCRAVFLGLQPYQVVELIDGEPWLRMVWGKQVGRCIGKIGWQRVPSVDRFAWLKGIAWATLISDGHVPVLRAWALSVLFQLRDVRMKVPCDLWKRRLPTVRREYVVIPATYHTLEASYNLPADDFKGAETALCEVEELPAMIMDCTIAQMVAIDAGF